ncbi:MAG: hypothetical protein MK319_00385, partial [Pseudomonadales bacterium]|nr:hypothetical protein [Pseudomonadales bacterium]
ARERQHSLHFTGAGIEYIAAIARHGDKPVGTGLGLGFSGDFFGGDLGRSQWYAERKAQYQTHRQGGVKAHYCSPRAQ